MGERSTKIPTSKRSVNILDLIRQSQKTDLEKRAERESVQSETEDRDGDRNGYARVEELDETGEMIMNLLNDEHESNSSGSFPEDSGISSTPKKKTELEKYLQSKKRLEQIKKYNENVLREEREERTRNRAKIRHREVSSDEEDLATPESSPTKKVRFNK